MKLGELIEFAGELKSRRSWCQSSSQTFLSKIDQSQARHGLLPLPLFSIKDTFRVQIFATLFSTTVEITVFLIGLWETLTAAQPA